MNWRLPPERDPGVRGMFREFLTPDIIAKVWNLGLEYSKGVNSLVDLRPFWAATRDAGLSSLVAVLAVEWLHRHNGFVKYSDDGVTRAIRVLPIQGLRLEKEHEAEIEALLRRKRSRRRKK